MNNSEWEETLRACDELVDLMNRHSAGPNPQALLKVRSLCARMRGTSTYINGRSNKVERDAETFFSARKWMNHTRGEAGVKYEIVQASVSRIRDEARNRIAEESKQDDRAKTRDA